MLWLLERAECAVVVVAQALGRDASPPITLELLRSELAHETAGKLARLKILMAEWSRGEYRPEDPADVRQILGDLRAICLRHARRAAGHPRSLFRLVHVLATIQALRRSIQPAVTGRALNLRRLRAAELGVERLRESVAELVELLSRRVGRRIAEIVAAATDEIRREIGGGLRPGSVNVVLDDPSKVSGGWVPRADEPMWSDLLRNLIRNAAEATAEFQGASSPGSRPPAVTVGLVPVAAATRVEVVDQGMGMSHEQITAMWNGGVGRHGRGRGFGLTEAKRAFVDSRAELTIRSEPGRGTRTRIDFPTRDIVFPEPRLASLAWLYLPAFTAALVLAGLAVGARRPKFESIRALSSTAIQALSDRGEILWAREFGEMVLLNDSYGDLLPSQELRPRDSLLVLRDARQRPRGVVVATKTPEGPGRVWSLDMSGQGVMHTLRWHTPRTAHLGELRSVWEEQTSWPETAAEVFLMNVRDGNYSETSIQFFTSTFDSLGAYYHHGHLSFRRVTDLDADGMPEILLFGINNPARHDTTIFRQPESAYVDCLVLLEPPDVNGQSYPYTAWGGMPRASEEGYLLLPPLRSGCRPTIRRIAIGGDVRSGAERLEVVLEDGRIYRLNGRLRPLSCDTGDMTLARRLAPTYPIAPLVYLHRGVREEIRLAVQ